MKLREPLTDAAKFKNKTPTVEHCVCPILFDRKVLFQLIIISMRSSICACLPSKRADQTYQTEGQAVPRILAQKVLTGVLSSVFPSSGN